MTFELQPTLRGDLVELAPLREEDWTELFAVARDPLIWEQHPARERYKEPVFRAFFDDAIASGGAFLVRDRRDGEAIGSSRYFGFDPIASEIEIGWTFLARSRWGGKYNGEMKRLMLEHAFQFVERVIFRVGKENIRSQRAVMQIGGVLAGRWQDTTGVERLVFEITRHRMKTVP